MSGVYGNRYYPEGNHNFVGQVNTPNLTLVEKSGVTQLTSVSTAVTIPSCKCGLLTTFGTTLAAAGTFAFVCTFAGGAADYSPARGDAVFYSLYNYTGTGIPIVNINTNIEGGFTVNVTNVHISAALSTTCKIQFWIV